MTDRDRYGAIAAQVVKKDLALELLLISVQMLTQYGESVRPLQH